MPRFRQLLPLILILPVLGGELNLEKKPFFIHHEFSATALPVDSRPIQLDPAEWSNFIISLIKPHGSSVKKDELLVSFDTEDFEKRRADLDADLSSKLIQFEQAAADLSVLEKTIPERLTRLKRAAETAAEELNYFTRTSRKSSEESANFSLKRQEQRLASTREELKQLLQMYAADDITEETEEIILQQQRDTVEYAEFALRMEKLEHQRKLKITIPTREINLTEARDDSALKLETAQKELPRSLALKKLEVTKLKTEIERTQTTIEELKKDSQFFQFKAPSDGIFYHGSIEEGKWTTGELVKNLRSGGSPPLQKAFATFIPDKDKLAAFASLDQATALALNPNTKGVASLSGISESSLSVTLREIAFSPGINQLYEAIFEISLPADLKIAPGQSLQIQLISYSTENAIVVPTKVLSFGPNGWLAEVKLANGKTEKRTVQRGKSSKEETEITSGLEAGQVILVP